MKRFVFSFGALAALLLVVMASCSDKNSQEACLYETTLNLDKANYDAVLASPCVNAMQTGAAWFGKAGFDIENVVNRMIDANTSSVTSTQTDLNLYMTALISQVTETTFTYLDNARTAYGSVTSPPNSVKDAQFYTSLVDTMKSLSLIKIMIDVDGDGIIGSSCDINNNNEADEVDAAACALKAASNISAGTSLTCTGASYSPLTPIDMTISNLSGTPPYTQTYSGLTITITGAPVSGCPSVYKKLLYKDPVDPSKYWLATTLPGENCTGGGGTWPCPLESNLDFVSTVDQTLTSAIDTLSTSITSTTSSDVQQSINDIKAQNCCTDPSENAAYPSTCTCSSSELATYLQTI